MIGKFQEWKLKYPEETFQPLQHIASRLKPEVDASLRGTSDQLYNTDLAGLVTNVHNLELRLLNEKVSRFKERSGGFTSLD